MDMRTVRATNSDATTSTEEMTVSNCFSHNCPAVCPHVCHLDVSRLHTEQDLQTRVKNAWQTLPERCVNTTHTTLPEHLPRSKQSDLPKTRATPDLVEQ